MKFKSEKGFTGIDIAISIVVLFIFVSLIAILIYNFNSSSKEAMRKTTAINLAIEEIENIKKNIKFEEVETISVENADTTEEGFFKTINAQDYSQIDTTKKSDLVKKVTVTISYNTKGQTNTVQLSTIITKEN